MEAAAGSWRSKRAPANPTKTEDLVDIGKAFGVSFGGSGDDTDSSDAEFAPENEKIDSEDSHEFDGDESVSMSSQEMAGQHGGEETMSMEEKEEEEEKDKEREEKEEDGGSDGEKKGSVSGDEGSDGEKKGSVGGDGEYNPLIVRRSQRAIKPTKDVDLYLLGAKFGIDLEGSDVDSSDQEFAPEADSEGGSSDSSEAESVTVEGVEAEKAVVVADTGSEAGSGVQHVAETVPQKFYLLLCSVCLEDSGEDSDLVECDRCGIAVHEGCYGIPVEEDVRDDRSDLSSFTTVPWFCDPCKAGLDTTLCCCELCPTKGGLFKQTIHGRWIHMVCALYTPSIEYVEPQQLFGVTLDQMPAARWGNKTCQLCDDLRLSKTGVCINCDAGLCKSSFHVTCAQHHGLLCEVDNEEEEEKDELCEPFFAHCKAHADKDLVKRKRRDYLTIIKRQRQGQSDDLEDRTKHYLEEAQARYKEMFDAMQSFYQPEKGFRGEDRWLYHSPSALQRLSQKAQLLGHVAEEVVGVTRWKVTPGLTVDFVKYFSDRQKLMSSLEEQRAVLQETYQHLREDQARVKKDHSATTHMLETLKSEMQTHLNCITALDQHLAKLGLEQGCILPAALKHQAEEEEGKEEEGEKEAAGVCAVCEKEEEDHLMVVCDTCHLCYHIHCLDPPLSKVPKKSAKWGWQCHQCIHQSGDELTPIIPNFDEPSSRSGRRIKVPQTLSYDSQVKMPKKKKPKLS